jgi:two-component system sensor histidine kinase HydH
VLRNEVGSKWRAIVADTLSAGSLRIKLVIFVALLIAVPGLLFAVIVQRNEQALLQDLIGRQLVREADHTADRLANVLRSERDALQNFAQQDLMREVRVDDIDKRVSAALATLRDGDPARLDYLVLTQDRRAIASSNPDWIGQAPVWAAGIVPPEAGSVRISGPIPTAGSEGMIAAASIPDPDTPSRTLGVLIGLYDWPRLGAVSETIRNEMAAQGIRARVLVTRSDGTVIGGASLTPEERAEFPPGWLRPLQPDVTDAPGYAVLPDADFLVGYAPIDAGLPGWKLVIVEQLSDALAPTRRMTARLAGVLAVTLVLALALAMVGARNVVKPLTELTAAIGSVSQGDLSSLRVAVRSDDEVGLLAGAFNRMAAELDQAQSDLVEAAKYALVGELAAGVAHEVRTSLGVQRSSAQILERSLPPDSGSQAAELAALIREEVDRLGRVVDDLLELGRPRALHLESVSLVVPLRRALEMVEPNASEHDIALSFDDSEPHGPVLGDPELIYQVALNLLVNAIQAVGTNGRVDVRSVECEGGYVGFEVCDDGPGIPEGFRDKLFRPFATAREGGIGLGLTFVQRVVLEHQGRIHVESEPGRGACFRIELPTEEGPA